MQALIDNNTHPVFVASYVPEDNYGYTEYLEITTSFKDNRGSNILLYIDSPEDLKDDYIRLSDRGQTKVDVKLDHLYDEIKDYNYSHIPYDGTNHLKYNSDDESLYVILKDTDDITGWLSEMIHAYYCITEGRNK